MLNKLLGFLVLSVLLSGCVTNTTGQRIPEANKEKALASHIQLGFSYMRNKNTDLARSHFEKALSIDPDSAGALNGQALLFQLEGEMDLAEKNFRKALKQDPRSSRARNNFGIFLYQQKRFPEAYEAFEIVSRDLEYSHRAGALLNLGRAALKLGKIERAEAVFRQSLALSPRMTPALLELADIKFQQKAFAESKRYLDRYDASSKPSARSLLLGIKIERVFGNEDKVASRALALKNLYPYSSELLEYQEMKK